MSGYTEPVQIVTHRWPTSSSSKPRRSAMSSTTCRRSPTPGAASAGARSPGWSRRRSRRWCGCIRRSTRSSRWRRGAGAGAASRRDVARDRPLPPAAAAPAYDKVIDAQGLSLGAHRACGARRRHGYDAQQHHGAFASRLYDVRHQVSRALHAVERNRIADRPGARLYAATGRTDYGLIAQRCAMRRRPMRVLLHATARRARSGRRSAGLRSRRWLRQRGFECVLPWGDAEERCAQRADRCAAIPNAAACSTASRSTPWRR